MLMDWMAPVIEKRILEISGEYDHDNHAEILQKKFIEVLTNLNNKYSIGHSFYELEELFYLNSFAAIEYSYLASFKDALKLFNLK
jgi:hypothetical protein